MGDDGPVDTLGEELAACMDAGELQDSSSCHACGRGDTGTRGCELGLFALPKDLKRLAAEMEAEKLLQAGGATGGEGATAGESKV